MKFVVDAHLLRRLCGVLSSHGHEAVHTLDLPAGNATSDEVINRISLDDLRVVISKDTDFSFRTPCMGEGIGRIEAWFAVGGQAVR